ncbi:DNA internalization-related competence protein ComEC/Rec2 [Aquabacterium sp.]|uniref:DNA internalization-related competence protein ComEC/Rec2 n=1 Tax=Aquabacterium sp. TaxID=1872578 RepID=UPI003B7200E3
MQSDVLSGWPGWLVLCVGWLLGVSLQLAESVLWAPSAYLAGLGGATVLLGCVGWMARAGRLAVPWRVMGVALVLVLMGWGSTGYRACQQQAMTWHGGVQDVELTVRTEGLPQPMSGGGVRFEAHVLAVRALSAAAEPPWQPGARVSLIADATSGLGEVTAGQTWLLHARLHAPDGLVNPGGHHAMRYLFEQGIGAVGSVRAKAMHPVMVSPASSIWRGGVDRFRQRVRTALSQAVPDAQAAGVLAGLAVGDQSAVDRADWDVFQRTGVSHVVSVSGTHVVMLGWLVAAGVRRVWSRSARLVHRWPAPQVAAWLSVGVSALYALVAGWGVPAQRTVWMMAAAVALKTSGRRWPWGLVLCGAAVLVTVWDPWALLQPGFWLSFVAVGVLMSDGAQAPTGGRWWQQAWQGARTQWRVSLALAPLALVCFQQASTVGLLANLVAIPVFTSVITPLALLGVVVHGVWGLGAWMTHLTMVGLSWLAAVPGAVWSTPELPFACQVAAVLMGALQFTAMPLAWRCMTWAWFLPLLYLPRGWLLVPPPEQGQVSVVAADVGQGTAVLVRTARHSLLFDAGGRLPSGVDMGQRVVVPLLRALDVTQLDELLISHEDTDHVGGALSVLQSVPTARLRSSLAPDHEVRAWHAPKRLPKPHTRCEAGQSWIWDGVRFDVLHPHADDYARRSQLAPNALSCVLRVSTLAAPQRSVLIAGDVEARQEATLIDRQRAGTPATNLASTILVAPHHGSDTSSTVAFLTAVAPQQVVVQAGARNRYRHPSPEVVKRYQQFGLNWVATPQCGAWVWHSQMADGGNCWRQRQAHYWVTQPTQASP